MVPGSGQVTLMTVKILRFQNCESEKLSKTSDLINTTSPHEMSLSNWIDNNQWALEKTKISIHNKQRKHLWSLIRHTILLWKITRDTCKYHIYIKSNHHWNLIVITSDLQGKATGNKPALVLRSNIQKQLFQLGCVIQKHAGKFLIFGILILSSLFGFGLNRGHIENRLEKLWVQGEKKLWIACYKYIYQLEIILEKNRLVWSLKM